MLLLYVAKHLLCVWMYYIIKQHFSIVLHTLTFTLGTVKLNGSIVLFVRRKALANSTAVTSQWFFVKKLKPWCNVGQRWCDSGQICDGSSVISNAYIVESPYNII